MIHQKINEFLQRFPVLSESNRHELAKKLRVQHFKKGEIIQREGEIPLYCFFVLGGCVRHYQLIEGVEKTLDFYTEEHAAISSECYLKKIPSPDFLICVEDSYLMVGDPDHDARLIEEFPVLQTIMMKVAEEEWLKTQNRLALFKVSSPESRYRNFLEQRSDLLNRVSNNQIASYLGITAESLSRIRKRMYAKPKQ